MNPLTQLKKTPILPLLIALALVIDAPALATPPVGVSTEFIVGSASGGATFARDRRLRENGRLEGPD